MVFALLLLLYAHHIQAKGSFWIVYPSPPLSPLSNGSSNVISFNLCANAKEAEQAPIAKQPRTHTAALLREDGIRQEEKVERLMACQREK